MAEYNIYQFTLKEPQKPVDWRFWSVKNSSTGIFNGSSTKKTF